MARAACASVAPSGSRESACRASMSCARVSGASASAALASVASIHARALASSGIRARRRSPPMLTAQS